MKKILYFSPVSWNWIKQRPHFVAQYLSIFGFDVTFFSIKFHLISFFENCDNVKNRNNHETLKISHLSRWPKSSVNSIINFNFRRKLIREFSKNYDFFILTSPKQYSLIKELSIDLNNKTIIYDCMDYMPGFTNDFEIRKDIEKNEMKLCNMSKLIICSSASLKRKITKNYAISEKKVEVINNGFEPSIYDMKHSKGKDIFYNLKHPNCVYIGTVGKWLDIHNIKKFAKDNEKYSIYLFGPYNKDIKVELSGFKNILFLGAIEHEKIPLVIENSDVLLIPFIVNELIECVDPVKAYEYIAAGKPFVSSYWNEMKKFKDFSFFYDVKNSESFAKAVKKANAFKINKNDSEDFLLEAKWENRIKRFSKLISDL